MKEINENNLNRLAVSIMEKHFCSYDDAVERLLKLKLVLVCSEEIKNSLPLQAAFLTAINTGKRAFLGGVDVIIPKEVSCLLPWPRNNNLNEVVKEIGANIVSSQQNSSFSLYFGSRTNVENNSLEVICNNWQGGVIINGDHGLKSNSTDNCPLGGIAAGSLAVALAFMVASEIKIDAADQSTGISLWRPDLFWLEREAEGPALKFLPEKFWLLGLGHLGQAYLWNIGLLPYETPSKVEVLLQDHDRIVDANRSAGLLSEKIDIGDYKTRVCAKWLEDRLFKTRIVERKFDQFTKHNEEEPLIALCGFDSAESRSQLEKSGFSLIVESALGGSLNLFDNIILHTFPDSFHKAESIWLTANNENRVLNKSILKEFSHLEEDGCGILAKNLANKAISSSFVGAFAGSLVIAELLRGLHGGKRYDTIVAQLRNLQFKKAFLHSNENSLSELTINGFCQLENKKNILSKSSQ